MLFSIAFKKKGLHKITTLVFIFSDISPPFVISSENAESAVPNSAKKGIANEFKKYIFWGRKTPRVWIPCLL